MLRTRRDYRPRLDERQRQTLRFMRSYGSAIMLIGNRIIFASQQAQAAWEDTNLGALNRRDALWLADNGYLVPTGNTNETRIYARVN